MFLIELDGYAIHIHSGYSIWASIRQVISKICLLLVSICTMLDINANDLLTPFEVLSFILLVYPYICA